MVTGAPTPVTGICSPGRRNGHRLISGLYYPGSPHESCILIHISASFASQAFSNFCPRSDGRTAFVHGGRGGARRTAKLFQIPEGAARTGEGRPYGGGRARKAASRWADRGCDVRIKQLAAGHDPASAPLQELRGMNEQTKWTGHRSQLWTEHHPTRSHCNGI